MKTTFLYGLGMAIAGAVLNFILYFAGMHDTPEKLQSSQTVGMVAGLVITVAGLVLAIRARRDETPLDEDFGYGRALGAGTLTALWGSLFGNLFNVAYMTVINPGLADVTREMQINAWEEQGLTPEQIDQAEGFLNMMSNPALQFVFGFIFAFLFSFVFALIIAAFIRRSAEESFDEAAPPPLES